MKIENITVRMHNLRTELLNCRGENILQNMQHAFDLFTNCAIEDYHLDVITHKEYLLLLDMGALLFNTCIKFYYYN